MYFIILAFIALATTLVWYLLKHDHGRKLPVATLWYACGFGVLAMVFASLLERFVLPAGFVRAPTLSPLVEQLLLFMGVGFIEEAAKFGPLALFIYKRPYFREYTDGCIYFAICGLTFGLGENIMYTVLFGGGVGIARLLLTPFFHAATTSILGYYLAKRKLYPEKKGLFILACVLVPAMHGLYDFGLGSGVPVFLVMSLMLTLLLTMGLFLYFMQANALDRVNASTAPLGYAAMAVQPSPQLVANFCSGCGRPNNKQQAYCEYCGRKL